METNKIYNMDCIEGLKLLADNSIDSIVTDPPYELGFMGKSWDNTGIAYNIELWKQALRVLKPGGYLLSFGGTRTYHRMACAIEDAGFEIRDQMQWIYSTGFPKSLNIGKAIDKVSQRLNLFTPFAEHFKEQRNKKGLTHKDIAINFLSKTGGLTGCVSNWELGYNVPTLKQWKVLQPMLDLSLEFLPLIERIEAEREVIGKSKTGGAQAWINGANNKDKNEHNYTGQTEWDITAPATDQAKQWDGWGTALKPANEPICVARKPLSEKTVAANVLKWGTGGINIDTCRIGTDNILTCGGKKGGVTYGDWANKINEYHQGRFPANVIFDEEAGALLDEQSGIKQSQIRTSKYNKSNPKEMLYTPKNAIYDNNTYSDKGGASRFFYCAKASKSERNAGLEGFEEKDSMKWSGGSEKMSGLAGKYPDGTERPKQNSKNIHPTVKPIKLMEYLVKLVTQPGGVVLDPFTGSGTTLIAAKKLGFKYIGIEREEEYCKIAEARVKSAEVQNRLF